MELSRTYEKAYFLPYGRTGVGFPDLKMSPELFFVRTLRQGTVKTGLFCGGKTGTSTGRMKSG